MTIDFRPPESSDLRQPQGSGQTLGQIPGDTSRPSPRLTPVQSLVVKLVGAWGVLLLVLALAVIVLEPGVLGPGLSLQVGALLLMVALMDGMLAVVLWLLWRSRAGAAARSGL